MAPDYFLPTRTDIVNSRQRDFATAAGYFSRLEPFYTERGWNLVGTSMLQLHAKCLKELERRPESIRVLLELIARAVTIEKGVSSRLRGDRVLPHGSEEVQGQTSLCIDDELFSVDGYVSDLAAYSRNLSYEIRCP